MIMNNNDIVNIKEKINVYGDEYSELMFISSKIVKYIHFPKSMNLETLMKGEWNKQQQHQMRELGKK